MKTTIYANYGMLAAEKRCIYTTRKSEAAVSEPLEVIIPDEFAPYESADGSIVVTIDGETYLQRDLLCGDENPCIVIPGFSSSYVALARA